MLLRYVLTLTIVAVAAMAFLDRDGLHSPTEAGPSAVTFREPAFDLPHIYAATDLELSREYGREVAKDRLGQLILLSRVGRGTLFQAFGPLESETFNDDVEARSEGYTSSELNDMFAKLPADVQAQLLEYARGVNDTIEAIYAGSEPKPLEVDLLQNLGLGADLFGNATNISDQVDPFYKAPGGDDPARPNAGFQFTPELVMSIAILQVRNFGSESFGEVSRLNELNSLLDKFPSTGDEIWEDLNFLNDPLAPVSVPESSTPGFGGPLAQRQTPGQDVGPSTETVLAQVAGRSLATADDGEPGHREEFARRLGAWPALGSYAWQIDGDLSATGNPWVGGFPQTGFQTPSIMHFVELRSAEGADHRIETRGMAFAGAPAVLIGETDSVAWTSTTAQLKNNDFYLETAILENADALRYDDEGTPAPMNMRTELIKHNDGSTTPVIVWRTHERMGNGGSRTVEGFQGDASGTVESATATSITDTGAFGAGFAGGYVAIIDGTGAGQIRPVLSSTADTLTLDAGDAWTVTPDATSAYVAVQSGNELLVTSRDRAFWLEESTTALGFALFQRAEDVLDIREASRLIPSTHNFLSADNQAFNGFGTDLGSGVGNTGYYSSGFSRVRQGTTPTDTRLPMDGGEPNELVVVGGTVDSASAGTLTDTGAFAGEDFSPPAVNFRLDNPTQQGSEYIVTITGGDGYRQTRRIASNTDDTLTLEADWGVVPSAGDLFEIYEIVAMPEAVNPPAGYTSNWNNKAALADDGRAFGRQHRNIFILERLAADSTWSRDEQRQLNEDVAGLDGKGAFGRYLIPRLREAVDAVGNGGNPDVDTALAALEQHIGSPHLGRGFVDPVAATLIAGEPAFLESLISELSTAIYGDEFAGTGISPPGGSTGLDLVQHAIDAAAGDVSGAYAQSYSGDYFNGADWRVVVRDALAQTVTDLGGIPSETARPDTAFEHPLSALFSSLIFDPTPIGNRGVWEQIVEVGPTVLGEFIFPLGQSGFVDTDGNPDTHATTLHRFWRDWRFVPMLHVAEDLAADPDGDVDDDGVLDGFEKWYFGSNAPLATDDADGDGLDLAGEYANVTDPTSADTEGDGCADGAELGPDEAQGGQRDPHNLWDYFNPTGDGQNRVDDILAVVAQFGVDEGQKDYTSSTDRTSEGPNPWNLGPPNGQQRVDDILNAVAQFGHDCA